MVVSRDRHCGGGNGYNSFSSDATLMHDACKSLVMVIWKDDGAPARKGSIHIS